MIDRHSPVGSIGSAPHRSLRTLTWDLLFPSLPVDLLNLLSHRADLNGSISNSSDTPPPGSTLEELLTHDRSTRTPFSHVKISDSQRPPHELHAISAALACPDLFLIDSPSGNDHLTIANELAREADRLGQRVLVLTAEPIDADKLVAKLRESCPHGLLRALGAGEMANQLPTKSAERTAKAVGDGAVSTAKTKVQQTLRELHASVTALQIAHDQLEPLCQLVCQLEQITQEETQVQQERDRLQNPTVRSEDTPLPSQISEEDSERSRQFTKLIDELQQASAKLAAKQIAATALNEQLTMLRQQADAKKSGGLFSIVKSMFSTNEAITQLPALEEQVRAHNESIQELESEVSRLTVLRADALEANKIARERMVTEEFARRQARVEQQLADLARDRIAAQAAYDRGMALLHAAGITGTGIPTTESVNTSLKQVHDEIQKANELRDNLDVKGATIARELLTACRIVIGPLTSLGMDMMLRLPEARFDRVIVTDSETLTDPQINVILKYAPTWVFIGDETSQPPNHNQRHGQHHQHRSTAFRRLWMRYHHATWVKDSRQLTVKLVSVAPSDRNRLRCEPVVDQPDIEVRFLPGQDTPTLAEVAFPAQTRIGQAKTYLSGELGEVHPTPCGAVVWHESNENITACWPSAEALSCHVESDTADLGDGIRELVVCVEPAFWTASLTFSRQAGWTLESAQDWLRDHNFASRTASLHRLAHLNEPTSSRKIAGVVG